MPSGCNPHDLIIGHLDYMSGKKDNCTENTNCMTKIENINQFNMDICSENLSLTIELDIAKKLVNGRSLLLKNFEAEITYFSNGTITFNPNSHLYHDLCSDHISSWSKFTNGCLLCR
ncbi:unnamed protein product [Heterobilharzia americana]|nr:unnamed protein product [Heterobilharzia americana]